MKNEEWVRYVIGPKYEIEIVRAWYEKNKWSMFIWNEKGTAPLWKSPFNGHEGELWECASYYATERALLEIGSTEPGTMYKGKRGELIKLLKLKRSVEEL